MIVLGMHRSGTSALTRILSLSGIQLPAHIVPLTDGHPKDGNTQSGFWESGPLQWLHDEALETAGLRWDDLHGVPSAWFESEIAKVFTGRLVATLEAEFGDAPIFVAKDPRACRLVPLWIRALEEMNVEPNWILSIRNPLDVAASLNRRDGFPKAKGLILWLDHVLEAERHTRHQKRLFVSFEDLLKDWRQVVARIGDRLEISLPRQSLRAAAEIGDFLNPALYHHSSAEDDVMSSPGVPSWVKDVFRWTRQAVVDKQEDVGILDHVVLSLHESETVYGPLLASIQHEARKKQETETQSFQEIENLQRVVADYERQLEEKKEYEMQMSGDLENLKKAFARCEQRIEESNTEFSSLRAEAAGRQEALAHADARIDELTKLTAEGQQEIARLRDQLDQQGRLRSGASPRVKALAFYLPQYHPIPENDRWWGKGFTEWTNVAKAKPSFRGHTQPLLPSELGFYDLRIPEVRAQQAALAREYGIFGFCYYYYWFHGKKLLERPIEEVLTTGEPDFPFCLCWANENWTRRWDGEDEAILIEQEHSPESDARFIDDVMPALLDPRYIKSNGKPLLLVYRADLMADPVATTDIWRAAARRAGLPGLHLCTVWRAEDPPAIGFDAMVEFPPHHIYHEKITHTLDFSMGDFEGEAFDYAAGVKALKPYEDKDFPVYRGVMPGWDNTARRGQRARLFAGNTPDLYGEWLRRVVREAADRPGEDDAFVFINAWNEWAEGATLEPSQAHGRAYLEATQLALEMGQAQPGLGRLERRFSNRCNDLDYRIDGLGDRIDGLGDRVDGLGDRVDGLGDRVDGLGDRLEQKDDASRQILEAHQSALHWLRDVSENLDNTAARHRDALNRFQGDVSTLTDDVTGLHRSMSSANKDLSRQLYEVKSRFENRPTRDLWLNSQYGLAALLLKLPFWLVRGRLGSRLDLWRKARRIRRSGLFDSNYYDERYPEVAAAGMKSLDHYVCNGAAEGRDPNPFLNGDQYLERFPEIAESGGNPLLHYLERGAWEIDVAEVGTARKSHCATTPPTNPTGPERPSEQDTRPGVVSPPSTEGETNLPESRPSVANAVQWTLNKNQLARRQTASMTLLFVSHDAYRAGSQIILLEIIKSFSRLPEFELYLLMRSNGELRADFERYAHVLDVREQSTPGLSEESAVIDAVRAMGEPPGLAICNTVVTGAVAKILRRLDLTVISLVYELPTTIESLGNENLHDTISSSQLVIVASEFVKNAFVKRYNTPADLLRVLHVGVIGWQPEVEDRDAARARIFARYGFADDTILVLGCGTIHHRKGTDLFVQVARNAILNYGMDNTCFLWVGDEQAQHFRSWCEHDIATFGLQDRILFTGPLDNTVDYYLAADVFVLTSREDPFPLVNLEALARGLPVIAFADSGGAQEALVNDTGIVVPYLDTAEMTRALVRLVEAPRYRAAFSERSLARAREHYHWDCFFDKLRELLMEHVAQPQSPVGVEPSAP